MAAIKAKGPAPVRSALRGSFLRRLLPIVAAALVATTLLPQSPQPVNAATWQVRLEAGIQVGYLFDSAGVEFGRKTVVLASPVSTTTAERRWITARGTHLRLTTGALAGYYVRESMVAYVPGLLSIKVLQPAARVAFPAGTYLGYRFDASWQMMATKRGVLSRASGALADRRVLIDGRPYAEMVSGIWAGYWIPIVSPTMLTGARLTCSAPAKVAAGSAQLFSRLPGADHQVALTFDLGGRTVPAMNILKRLVVDRVCATIFPTGETARTAAGQQILRFVGAHRELFEVGNHTEHHCNLRDGGGGAACPATRPSRTFVRSELSSAATVIQSLTGQVPAPYWRPPYGAQDATLRSAAAAAGYTKTFMWDIDTIDWRPVTATPTPGPTAAQIAEKVAGRAVNGSLVLMHLGGYNTFDALPSTVMRLRAAGLTPTTISQILR
jgi:peptidoglycan/xylan/chitin deacetylase (PgdA/CDA1 family)